VLLSVGPEPTLKAYSKGRPFYNALTWNYQRRCMGCDRYARTSRVYQRR